LGPAASIRTPPGLLHPELLVTDQMALRDITAAFAKVDRDDPGTIKVVLNIRDA
jgi:hypothetical protein